MGGGDFVIVACRGFTRVYLVLRLLSYQPQTFLRSRYTRVNSPTNSNTKNPPQLQHRHFLLSPRLVPQTATDRRRAAGPNYRTLRLDSKSQALHRAMPAMIKCHFTVDVNPESMTTLTLAVAFRAIPRSALVATKKTSVIKAASTSQARNQRGNETTVLIDSSVSVLITLGAV